MQRRFVGTNLKSHKLPENAATPTRRVHAVLGTLIERQTRSLEQATTADLTKLLHERCALATIKNTTCQNTDRRGSLTNLAFRGLGCYLELFLRASIVSNTFWGVTSECRSIPSLPAMLGKLILTFAV